MYVYNGEVFEEGSVPPSSDEPGLAKDLIMMPVHCRKTSQIHTKATGIM